MAAKTSTRNPILDGIRGSINKAKSEKAGETTKYNYQELPVIPNGVAILEKCIIESVKEGENKGKPRVLLEGSIDRPYSVDTPAGKVVTYGLKTILRLPLYGTKTKDLDEAVGDVLNEFRKLGFDTKKHEAMEIDEMAAAIQESKMPFRFSTRMGKETKKPDGTKYPARIWESWNGVVEDYEPGESEGMVSDSTAPSKNGKHVEKDEGDDNTFDLDQDLTTLADKADLGDEKARERLTVLAIQAGHSKADVKSADSWGDVAEMISGSADENDEVETYEEGQDVTFSDVDPKTKKSRHMAAKILHVYPDEEEADIKVGKLVMKRVGFDKLNLYRDLSQPYTGVSE